MKEVERLKKRIEELEAVLKVNKPRPVRSLSTLTKKELIKLVQTYSDANKEFQTNNYADVMYSIKKAGVDYRYEQMYFVVMNHRNIIIDVIKVDSHKKNEVSLEADIILKKILNVPGAERIAMAHNHPVGGVMPSDLDDKTTAIVYSMLYLVGLELMDSLVFDETKVFSYMEHKKEFFDDLKNRINRILSGG
jgi:DNA repair protein RadC